VLQCPHQLIPLLSVYLHKLYLAMFIRTYTAALYIPKLTAYWHHTQLISLFCIYYTNTILTQYWYNIQTIPTLRKSAVPLTLMLTPYWHNPHTIYTLCSAVPLTPC
jgi:hypothetical protein